MTAAHRGLGIEDILADKREAILRLAAEHGAINVRVFGSVARGEATPDSDVDFLVEFETGADMFDAVALWQDLTTLLEREVDVVTAGADVRFDAQAAQDAVAL